MVELYEGDCLEIMPTIPAESIDAVICDPPYPEIDRDYGRMTEAEWFAMMQALIPEVRRALKPQGSAVFILQPNFKAAASMRLWLWEFMVWVGREWNLLQDVYWMNTTPFTTSSASMWGLMRGCIKPCVWVGNPDAYRNQDAVLWKESDRNLFLRMSERLTNDLAYRPSGGDARRARYSDAAGKRGGVTPMNVIPLSNGNSTTSAGAHGHGAGTPAALADWWIRYICPPGGTVLDPFAGSGTIPLEAIKNQCSAIGIERMSKYYEIMRQRVEAEEAKPRTLRMELTA